MRAIEGIWGLGFRLKGLAFRVEGKALCGKHGKEHGNND